MKRRIAAWLMLLGFILLIANIVFFHFKWQISMVIYITLAILFLFTAKKQ